MNEKNIEPNTPETSTGNEFVGTQETVEKRNWKQRKPMIIAASIIGAVLLGVLALVFLRSGSSGGGQPVPAPRSVSVDGAGGEGGGGGETLPAGQTITIPAEQIETAGIKVETVGEQLSTEAATTSATGVIQANSYRDTPAISLVGGLVRRIIPQLGDNVSAGQTVAVVYSNEFAETQSRYVALQTETENARRNFERTQRLVTINQTGRGEFEQAEKQLTAAEAQLSEMRKRYARTAKLIEIGAASREELEQDTTKLRTAEAEVAEARLRLNRARQLLVINPQSRAENEEAANKLRTAEAELAATRQKLILYGLSPQRAASLRSVSQITSEIAIPAPISGTVTARAINQGEVIEANKEILRVTDLNTVWAVAQVFERDLARLRVGSGASVRSDAFPDRLFRGTVTYIDPRLDENTRTAQVRVELQNPGNILKIGMYVNVALGALGQAEQTAPVIPASAVQNINNRQIVFVATNEPNVFELRPVRLGSETGGQIIVLEGLTVGDKVVTDGSFMLRAEWLKQKTGF